jgi:hypothetical protein
MKAEEPSFVCRQISGRISKGREFLPGRVSVSELGLEMAEVWE